MRVFAFILISLFAGVAGTVVSAQVTAKFKAERERLEAAANPCPTASRRARYSITGSSIRSRAQASGFRRCSPAAASL